MLILTLRTDKPEAELGLYKDNKQLAYHGWEAHRQLAETIHLKIKELLESQKSSLENLEGLVFFEGPGSFTGLRIGASVANALAAGLKIPVIGTGGENWREKGVEALLDGKSAAALPKYGAPARTTRQKK